MRYYPTNSLPPMPGWPARAKTRRVVVMRLRMAAHLKARSLGGLPRPRTMQIDGAQDGRQ